MKMVNLYLANYTKIILDYGSFNFDNKKKLIFY